MKEADAKELETHTVWNGKVWTCIHCGRVPETFYVATGHDHTDYDIKWCPCRMKVETIESLRAEVELGVKTELKLRQQLATLEANNALLRETLKSLILATKHLNPCPGTVEMCLEALNATKEQP